MNSKLFVKTAVAAALLSAASIPAFATSVTPPASGPTPVPGLAAGGIVVEVWDTTTGHALTEWLGPDTTSFGAPSATPAAGGTQDYGVLGGSSFASTFSAAEIALGNVQWTVVGADDRAAATPTIDFTASTLGTSITAAGVNSAASRINTAVALMNSASSCNNVNPCIATTGATDPNWLASTSLLGASAIGSAKTAGVLGTTDTMDFYQIVTASGGNSLTKQTPVQFANATGAATWSLSASGDLVYSIPAASPVPLPAAVWLLGSGLLGLLGVGRRKVLAA